MILVNKKEVKIEKFPNGEVLIKDFGDIVTANRHNIVTLAYENDQDLINLMFIKKHLDFVIGGDIRLVILYMPYSRMDRTEGKNVFTLKYVCEMINDLGFSAINLVEPHSDVTPALLNNCEIKNITKMLTESLMDSINFDKDQEDYLVFPDLTADKRYNKGKWEKTLSCIKHRDFETGRIKSLEVIGEKPKKPFRAIIVDDLCSRGGTFMLTAQKLRDMGATEVRLVVTHCEDSIHDGDILKTDVIDKVHTTNTILKNCSHKKLEITKVR